jgi:predicted HAD superfamily phosphohydrolase YqeG
MLDRLDLEPNEVIFLGDQFITDVWVANRIGCKSILVLPIINQSNDNSSSRLIRFLDKFIYKKLEYGNYLRLDYARGEGLGDEHQFI